MNSTDEALLKELAEALDARRRSEDLITDVVDDLRLRGVSWQSIADVLGVSRQAAQKKYAIYNDGQGAAQ